MNVSFKKLQFILLTPVVTPVFLSAFKYVNNDHNYSSDARKTEVCSLLYRTYSCKTYMCELYSNLL